MRDRYAGVVDQSLKGKISLVTGASRGIGAATAIKLAQAGSDVVLNYRQKSARAEEVAGQIQALGRRAVTMQADLTQSFELKTMMNAIEQMFGRLDIVILNASGGLEKDRAKDYAMTLNLTAQLETARLSAALMPAGSRIVFVTSHWAHFYGAMPVMPEYEIVAKSKRAGEDALRAYEGELKSKGISLVVVSGDAIEGTITIRLLERNNQDAVARRRQHTSSLPTVNEFANAIADAATNSSLTSGHTVFVGPIDE